MIVKEVVAKNGVTVLFDDDACRDATPGELERRRRAARDAMIQCFIERARREGKAAQPGA